MNMNTEHAAFSKAEMRLVPEAKIDYVSLHTDVNETPVICVHFQAFYGSDDFRVWVENDIVDITRAQALELVQALQFALTQELDADNRHKSWDAKDLKRLHALV